MRTSKLFLQLCVISGLLWAIVLSGCATGQQTPASGEASKSATGADSTATLAQTDSSRETGPQLAAPAAADTVEKHAPAVATLDPALVLIADRVTTLDPYRMVSTHPEGSVASHIWDTLTVLNDNLQVEPHLAESWRLVNNFTWEFKLRPGVSFHNGEPLNASAVRFSIERARSMPGSLETFAADVDLDNIEIVDDYTFRLTTRQVVVNLPYYLTFLEILPPVYYSETSLDQVAVAPVGSGPYELSQEWSPGQPVALQAVPTYWKGAPALPHLIFETIPLPEERLAALRLEKAALVTDLPPIPADQWDVPGSQLETIESTQRMFIGLRIEDGSPLADKRVRQALNYGVDVAQITGNWLEGYGERYGSWVNPPANNPALAPWPYDPDLARQLLAEAGFGQGFTTTLRTPAGVYYNDVEISKAIAQQLGQIGVTVQVESVSNWGVYTHDLLAGNSAPLFLLGLNSRGDALDDAKNLSATFAFNPTGWRNKSFEETLGRALSALNENSRSRLLDEAQAIAYEEAPWIWLWRQYRFYGVSQNLDWAPRRDGLVNLYRPAASTDGSAE